MLSCNICGETVNSEPDMKAHLIVHMENEIICPFCKLSGINYNEICFHIETVHFEQNAPEKNSEKLAAVQYGHSDRKNTNLQSTAEVTSGIHSACASSFPKESSESLPKDRTVKHEAFYTENITESRKYQKSREKKPGLSEAQGSISTENSVQLLAQEQEVMLLAFQYGAWPLEFPRLASKELEHRLVL